MGSIGTPTEINQQSIVLNHENYIEYAVKAAAWGEASLMFVIDNINHLPGLDQILQNHLAYPEQSSASLSAKQKFERILDLNSPLKRNHVFLFKADIAKGHNFNYSTVYICFCNKLFDGNVNELVVDTMNLVIGNDTSRLVVQDSRQEPNMGEIRNVISSYLEKIPNYLINVQVFGS